MEEVFLPLGMFNYKRFIEITNDIVDLKERLLFLQKQLEEYRELSIRFPLGVGIKGDVFSERLRESIDELKEQIKKQPKLTGKYNAQIFKDEQASVFFFSLLEYFKEKIDTEPLAYLSFIYWTMQQDNYLNDISPGIFRKFLNNEILDTILDKLKTLEKSTTYAKVKGYSICKDKIQRS